LIIPDERNFVLSPRHQDFARLAINPSQSFSFDPTASLGPHAFVCGTAAGGFQASFKTA
jgi:hypothetical protein